MISLCFGGFHLVIKIFHQLSKYSLLFIATKLWLISGIVQDPPKQAGLSLAFFFSEAMMKRDWTALFAALASAATRLCDEDFP